MQLQQIHDLSMQAYKGRQKAMQVLSEIKMIKNQVKTLNAAVNGSLLENLKSLLEDIESEEIKANTEWPFSIQQTIYSFIKRNLSTSTTLASSIGITEKGRFRFDASTDLT